MTRESHQARERQKALAAMNRMQHQGGMDQNATMGANVESTAERSTEGVWEDALPGTKPKSRKSFYIRLAIFGAITAFVLVMIAHSYFVEGVGILP